MIKINGKLDFLGRADTETAQAVVGGNCIRVRSPDGRVVLIAGLTEQECRKLAGLFMDNVEVNIDMAVPS